MRDITKIEKSWLEQMQEQWIEEAKLEARKEGIEQGKRETILRLATLKFGPLSDDFTARLQAIEAVDELDKIFDQLMTVINLSEIVWPDTNPNP